MNEKEAREILSIGVCKNKSVCCHAAGYLEAIEKAEVLANYLRAFLQDCECPVDYRQDAEDDLAQWEKEK